MRSAVSGLLILCVGITGCHDFDALVSSQDASSDGDDDAGDASVGRVKPTHIDESDWLYEGGKSPFTELGRYLIATSDMVIVGAQRKAGSVVLCKGFDCPTVGKVDLRPQPQANDAPDIAVLLVDELSIPSGVTLEVQGSRPLAILSRGDVNLGGSISVGAFAAVPGPGGRAATCATVGEDTYAEVGVGRCGTYLSGLYAAGSGGANGGKGGAGGAQGAFAYATPLPGSAWRDLLIGGGGGGSGAVSDGMTAPAPSGAGGGALQITSATRIRMEPTASITSFGAGGHNPLFVTGSGGAGGAGGTLFLEAPEIVLAGALAVTGGGGAGGDANAEFGKLPQEGDSGDATANAASGGAGSEPDGEALHGGHGGGGMDPHGEKGKTKDVRGGGGGGGGGRVILKFETIDEVAEPLVVPRGITERVELDRVDSQGGDADDQ